jgi:uracil-DNA glycosylase family 4
MTDLFTCPVCNNNQCVPPSGPQKSPILVVGEFPGEIEIEKGKPMVGRMGTILKMELGRLGIDLNRLRLCNLWQHIPNNNEECYKHGMEIVIQEAKDKKAILLLGSESVKCFTGEKVSDVCGLQLQSNYFSAPIIIACVNPAVVFHGAVGEMRLALKKFSAAIEGII